LVVEPSLSFLLLTLPVVLHLRRYRILPLMKPVISVLRGLSQSKERDGKKRRENDENDENERTTTGTSRGKGGSDSSLVLLSLDAARLAHLSSRNCSPSSNSHHFSLFLLLCHLALLSRLQPSAFSGSQVESVARRHPLQVLPPSLAQHSSLDTLPSPLFLSPSSRRRSTRRLVVQKDRSSCRVGA
jgi:hypothetical protein